MKNKSIKTALGYFPLDQAVQWLCKRETAIEVFCAVFKKPNINSWQELVSFLLATPQNVDDPSDLGAAGYSPRADALIVTSPMGGTFVQRGETLWLLQNDPVWAGDMGEVERMLGKGSECQIPKALQQETFRWVPYLRPATQSTPSDEELAKDLGEDDGMYQDFLDRLDQEFGEEVVEDEDC